MTDPVAYLATARKLLANEPSQADIRRSISTTYYAMFHHACLHFSKIVLQPTPGTYSRARLQAYRYLDHGLAKQRCLEAKNKDRKFPPGIVHYADAFMYLQQQRIDADYNPSHSYQDIGAMALTFLAEIAIDAFDAEPVEAQRAFVVFLALRPKNR